MATLTIRYVWLGILSATLLGCQGVSDRPVPQTPLKTGVASTPSPSPTRNTDAGSPITSPSSDPGVTAVPSSGSEEVQPSPTPEPQANVIRSGKAEGTTVAFPDATPAPVIQATVKRWVRGLPIIDVTFNQTLQFEMLLDPEASSSQITPAAADLLELPITQQTMDADAKPPRLLSQGRVRLISVDQLRVNNLLITVGGNALKVGVLGQDFLDNFKVETDPETVYIHLR